MSTLILPAAGKSTRFPNMKPKWLLTHPSGNIMAHEAVKGLTGNFERKILITLQSILDQFGTQNILKAMGPDWEICALDVSNSHVHTVIQCIHKEKLQGQVFIKDTDNYFRMNCEAGNWVSTLTLEECGKIDPKNKSYVVRKKGYVDEIFEKQIHSNEFCTGLYAFESPKAFMKFSGTYSHISDVINEMNYHGHKFSCLDTDDYFDWGTIEDWNEYKNLWSTLFLDIDGVLLSNTGGYFEPKWGQGEPIRKNIEYIRALFATGRCHIILTTSRDESCRDATIEELSKLQLGYHNLVMGLPHARRVVVNDYAKTNPFRSCDHVNIERDTDQLPELLGGVLS